MTARHVPSQNYSSAEILKSELSCDLHAQSQYTKSCLEGTQGMVFMTSFHTLSCMISPSASNARLANPLYPV
jgi:hypothetical protein